MNILLICYFTVEHEITTKLRFGSMIALGITHSNCFNSTCNTIILYINIYHVREAANLPQLHNERRWDERPDNDDRASTLLHYN